MIETETLEGKVAWFLRDIMGVISDRDPRPVLGDADAYTAARGVIELIDRERQLTL